MTGSSFSVFLRSATTVIIGLDLPVPLLVARAIGAFPRAKPRLNHPYGARELSVVTG